MDKQAAINQIMSNPATSEAWKSEAIRLTLEFLCRVQFVIALDIREYLESIGFPEPHHNRIWGGLFQRLHRAGVIRPTNRFIAVNNEASHNAPRRVWESMIYQGSR